MKCELCFEGGDADVTSDCCKTDDPVSTETNDDIYHQTEFLYSTSLSNYDAIVKVGVADMMREFRRKPVGSMSFRRMDSPPQPSSNQSSYSKHIDKMEQIDDHKARERMRNTNLNTMNKPIKHITWSIDKDKGDITWSCDNEKGNM